MNEKRNSRVEILAYKIWEEQGRPEGRHEENWAEAERRLRFDSGAAPASDGPTVSDDPVASSRMPDALTRGGETQNTPGRSNPASSRQQTQRDQATQTGSPEIDRKPGASRRARDNAERR
jgi:hypothetical protein